MKKTKTNPEIIPAIAVIVLMLTATSVFAGDIVDVTMDVSSGTVDITAQGFDHTTWHPNQVGEINTFTGMGGWSGNYRVNEGSYGILNSFVNVNSYEYGADFVMTDTQYFNVMSGNHINNVVGGFYAESAGDNDQVTMNLKSIGSMYVWSEATNPYSLAPLRGNYIEKNVWTTVNGVPNTNLDLWVSTSGVATMSNSNIWGWTNGETGTSNTNYGVGTRSVSATGSGNFNQYGFGDSSLTFNGFTFGAGTVSMGGSFTGGMSGTYSMSAS